MIKTHLTVQIVTHFLLTVFYSISLSSSSSSSYALQSGSLLLIPNGSSGYLNNQSNSSIELSTDSITRLVQDDPSLINATSDIPIWDSSNIDNDSINETIKSLTDNMDNLTTPVFIVPDELDVTINGKLDNLSDVTTTPNGNLTDLSSTPPTKSSSSPSTTTTTSESTTSSDSESPSTTTISTTLSMNESKVLYETTIATINKDEHLSGPDKSGGDGGGSTDEDAELLSGENQASRVACILDGDLRCSGSVPTCYGSGNIECDSVNDQESLLARRRPVRSHRSVRSSVETSVDQCQVSGDIICSPMVSRSLCKGSAVCKADKMEETMMAYNYWQILLIAGALAIICVTIIVVGIVGYFSWTRYKVRPEANGQAHHHQASNKA